MNWISTDRQKPEIGKAVIVRIGKNNMPAYYNGRNFFEWNTEEIVPIDRPEYWAYIETLPAPKKTRSLQENSYMHLVFNQIAEHTGHSMQDIKGYYKFKFGIAKTSELSVAECEAFLENVRKHALEFLGVVIPLPNEGI